MDMIPRALTIAGSDSGGGAGIQADLKTFTAHNVFGMSVLTSITAQNTVGVTGVHDLPPEFVRQQLDAVATDIGIDAAKTGMLSNREIIEVLPERIKHHRIENLVVDTVMRAKSGDPLLRADAQQAFIKFILPLALVATPNLPEAETITGKKISSLEEMKNAAKRIVDKGAKTVLVKGGHHMDEKKSVDVFYDGKDFTLFEAERIPTKNTHGTGCTLSAAIAANLAKGVELKESIRLAKEYVTEAIRCSFELGMGHGPLNHFWSTTRTESPVKK